MWLSSSEVSLQHTIRVETLGPQGHAMARAIESCVHCGFCLPACPTYRELGAEMDSPRGRILLMKSGRIVAELDQWRTELVADTLGTVGEIVRWARLLKRKTTKRQIRNWIERGRMHDRGEGLDEQGRRAKLYRLGDALDLCDTSRAKGA